MENEAGTCKAPEHSEARGWAAPESLVRTLEAHVWYQSPL